MTDRLLELVCDPVRAMDAYAVPRPPDVRVKLDANESPFPLPPELLGELAEQLASVALHRYPDPSCNDLRVLLAGRLEVAPAQLAFGNGSDELIGMLVTAFSRPRPGLDRARVLYPVPTFAVYRIAALAAGALPVEVGLTGDYELDEGTLLPALADQQPNVAFFARPNNPTGTLWSRALIEHVLTVHRDTLVVVDEAYIDYGGDSFLHRLDEHDNLVILRTLSKIGLAGARVGYLVASEAIVAQIDKVRPPYNVGSLNQRAAAWLLAHHGHHLTAQANAVRRERERLRATLAALPGVHVYASEANLLLFRVADAANVWRGLVDRGVLVRRFDGPGALRSCLRVTVGTAEHNAAFVAALRDALG